MKKVEFKAFIRSFLLYFLSIAVLVATLFFFEYKRDLHSFDDTIFSEMKICSFNLKCEKFQIGFAPLQEEKLYKLHQENTGVSAYFPIPNSQKNALQIYLDNESYQAEIDALQDTLLWKFALAVIAVFLLSVLFALYTLAPLRDALILTEEFVKDILHDFNTPLSTLRLNTSMLKNEFGQNSKILRIEKAVQNILNLQENLKAYLKSHIHQLESFELHTLLDERIALISPNHQTISFHNNVEATKLITNKDSFIRIIDNLLSNAAKYNKQNGEVFLSLSEEILSIKDTGKGIQNTVKVFDRFYKEQERGIGIGLHIVQKLSQELSIPITVKSELQRGSTFTLDLKNILN